MNEGVSDSVADVLCALGIMSAPGWIHFPGYTMGKEAASLCIFFKLWLSPQGSRAPQRGAPSRLWCLPWRPYKAIVYTGAHSAGLQLPQ